MKYQIKDLKHYKIVTEDNPFKEGTIENFIVDFVITVLKKSHRNKTDPLIDLNDELYKYINIKKNHLILLENCYNNPINWGFWLCLNHNIIVENTSSHNVGIYFCNPFIDFKKKCMREYHEYDKPERLLSYFYNISLTNKIKKNYNIPIIPYSDYDIYTHTLNKLQDSNIQGHYINNVYHNEMNQKWLDYDDCEIHKGRNIIHHTSDDYSLFWAMKNIYPNSTYILTNGELNQKNAYNFFNKDKVMNSYDFDYTHGIHYIHYTPGTYSNIHFNNEVNNDSQLMIENSKYIYEHHWTIKSFVKKAARTFTLYNGKELEEKIKNDFLKYIPETKNIFLKELENLETEIDSYLKESTTYEQRDKLIEKLDQFLNKYLSNFPLEKYLKENQFFYKSISSKLYCGVFNNPETTSFDKKENIDGSINTQVNYFDYINVFLRRKIKKPKKTFALSFKNYFLLRMNIYWDAPLSYRECFYDIDEKTFVISEIVNMKYEYRIFVIDGKPVCSTACYRDGTPYDMWLSGRFDPRLSENHNSFPEYNQNTRNLTARYIKFAKTLSAEMKLENPNIKHYVLDLSYDEENDQIIPIELNSINHSGLYMLNTHYLIKAVKKYFPTEKEEENDETLSMDQFLKMREESFKSAKNEVITYYEKYYSKSNDIIEKINNFSLMRNKK